MPAGSSTHCVIIPTFNSGDLLGRVVREVAAVWLPIWVVVDGSTDGSERAVAGVTGVQTLVLPENVGKGGAVLAGLRAANAVGMTHALVMDGDGQHSAAAIAGFMALSRENSGAMVLGRPVFGPEAPVERVKGRRIGNWFAQAETLWGGIGDSLFGFRVYPVRETLAVMERIRTARRFDFDTEVAVRLYWAGVEPINQDAPVRYPDQSAGGVTHFRYLRDNVLLVGAHTRLMLGMLVRLPWLVRLRWVRRRHRRGMAFANGGGRRE